MKHLFALLLLLGCASAAFAQPQVEIKTSMGSITLELYPDKAPKTVANFLQYVKDGQFKGTIFHRVIAGFMVQGGGFTVDGNQKATRTPIELEARNGLANDTGTVAMARTNDPNSATAQFFINVADNGFLNAASGNPGYAVFGKVISGMDVVKKIEAVKTGPGKIAPSDVPAKPIIIEEVRVVKAS